MEKGDAKLRLETPTTSLCRQDWTGSTTTVVHSERLSELYEMQDNYSAIKPGAEEGNRFLVQGLWLAPQSEFVHRRGAESGDDLNL